MVQIILLFLLVSFNSNALKIKEINADNLTYLALSYSTPLQINNYVNHLLQNKHLLEYIKTKNNKGKLAELTTNIKTHLEKNIEVIASNPIFTYKTSINYSTYDAINSKLWLSSENLNEIKLISRLKMGKDGLDPVFYVLFSNLDLLKTFNTDNKKFEELKKSKQSKKGYQAKKLYLELQVEINKFQNNHDFQAIIKNAKLYDSPQRKILLSTNHEKRSNEQFNNWFLSEGFSNPLVAIHAFSFMGYRVQDLIQKIQRINPYCKKTKHIGKHQVIVCQFNHTTNSQFIISYLGGLIAGIDLVATAKLQKNEKKIIAKQIMQNLNKDKNIFQHEKITWQKYNVDFTFYSSVFFNESKNTPHYENIFVKDKLKNTTPIISIMSHQTKKLIKEIQ